MTLVTCIMEVSLSNLGQVSILTEVFMFFMSPSGPFYAIQSEILKVFFNKVQNK